MLNTSGRRLGSPSIFQMMDWTPRTNLLRYLFIKSSISTHDVEKQIHNFFCCTFYFSCRGVHVSRCCSLNMPPGLSCRRHLRPSVACWDTPIMFFSCEKNITVASPHAAVTSFASVKCRETPQAEKPPWGFSAWEIMPISPQGTWAWCVHAQVPTSCAHKSPLVFPRKKKIHVMT